MIPRAAQTTLAIAALSLSMVAPARAQNPGPLPPPEKNPAAQPASQPQSSPQEAAAVKPATAQKIVLPAGTRLPLVLHNAISTRSARSGDLVYLETLFPIVQDNRIIIPAGSYVSGEVVGAKRAGRVKGRAELLIRLNTLILPNGYTVSFKATPSNAGTGGGESTTEEGTIKGDSDKASDAGTIVKTTSIGAGIGGIAGRSGKSAGIGAGVGAGVGLLGVLLSRGPDAEMPRGTTLEVTMNRPLYLDADKINFTSPGQASTLAGPPNRNPQRSKVPF
jgi:hypothetical protein